MATLVCLFAVSALMVGCAEEMKSPTPSLTSVSPSLVCSEQLTTTVTITGSGLSPVVTEVLDKAALELPQLKLQQTGDIFGAALDATVEQLTIDDSQEGNRVRWVSQETMEFDVDDALALMPGLYDLRATNPDGQEAHLASAMVVVPPPTIQEVVPTPICTEQFENVVTINGEYFITVEGTTPSVQVGDLDASATATFDDCQALAGPTQADSCNSATITIPQGELAVGDHLVTLTNPSPIECATTEQVFLQVVPPPVVSSLMPTTICSTGSEFTVTGTNFRDGAIASVGGVDAVTTTFVSDTELQIQTGNDLTPGLQDLTVTNAEGCSDTLTAVVEVVPGPILFFVDPPVVYDGISTQVSLLVGGVAGEIVEVRLENPATGDRIDLEFSYDSANDPNRIYATIPQGTAAADYNVVVVEDTACAPILENAVTVSSDLTVAVDSVRPSFGWTNEDTSVELRTADPLPGGQTGFEEIPRVYLNPANPTADTVAIALSSVTYQSADRVNAVVPSGLDAGVYDLVVVNPSGSIGLLEDSFTVTVERPPVINSVSPTRVDTGGGTIIVNGTDFRAPALELNCQPPGGGDITTLAVTVDAADATSATGTVPSMGEAICVVRLTNDDGSFSDYSAVSIGSTSGNLFPFRAGPDMNVGRRGLGSTRGRATREARYIYAVGGDDGDPANAMTSIEAVPIDAFGGLGAWSELPATLPQPRTMIAASTVDVGGRFIYVLGGNDGSGPVDTVLRAQVLNPRLAPEFDNLGIDFAENPGEGLGGGLWTYRIAAIFDANDPVNPDGESLASDPIVLQLPEISTGGVILSISWTQVPDAVGYRVYRSPAADAGSNSERLVAELTGADMVSYTDDGSVMADMGMEPLPDGALGNWATVATLTDAREGACAVVTPDPDDPDNAAFIHVAGGQGSAGLLDTIEVIPVSIVDGNTQTVSAPFDAGVALGSARWQCGAFSINSIYHTVPAGEAHLFFGPGDDGGGASGTFEAVQVNNDGTLSGFVTADANISPTQAGYASASASNFLYIFGGQQGNVNNSAQEGEVQTLSPTYSVGWSSLGSGRIQVARLLASAALESATIFVVGGLSDNNTATTATEITNF